MGNTASSVFGSRARTWRRAGAIVTASLLVAGSPAPAQHFEYEKLLAPDGGAYDDFGYGVSMQDGYAIAGAYGDDGAGGTDSGSAYVFRRSGPDWLYEQKLEANDAASADYFGFAAKLHNGMALVGAIGDDPGGAVYVFRRTSLNGPWQQVQKIVPPDGGVGIDFGAALDAHGRYMAVGARRDSDAAIAAGSVYMYEYEDASGRWVYLSEFRAADASANEWFGERLGVWGDYVVVGVPRDDPNGSASGSAYVFRRSGGTWSQQARLFPSDGAAEYRFGSDVAIDADTIAVGASDDWPAAKRSGSVYVFRGSGASWPLEQKLFDATSAANHWDRFGAGVDVIADVLLVGARGSDLNGVDRGAAYAWTRSGSTWTPRSPRLFAFDGSALDDFGGAVDLDGPQAIVGAFTKSDHGQNSGAAYAYNNIHFLLAMTPEPPRQGTSAVFTVTGGAPRSPIWLGYSLTGLRQTYIAPLNITIELRSGVQAGGMRTTDANGAAAWILPIPNGSAGRSLWIQALQRELKTNVIATQIQP